MQSFCQQLWRSHPAHLISLDMKVTSILSTASQQKGKVFRFATARKLSEDSEVKCNWKYCNAPGCRSIFLGVPAARLSFSTEATTWQQIDQCTNCTEDVYMDKDSRSRVAQSLTFSKILFDKIDNIIWHLYPRIRFTCVVWLPALKCSINSINSCAPRGLWDCSWLQFIEKLMEHDGTWWSMMEHVLPASPRQAPLRACTWPWILWQVQYISSSTSTCFGPVQAILLQEINQPLLMPRSEPISFFKLQTGATLQSQARNKPQATGQRIDFGLSSCLLNLMLISNYTCSRSAKNLVLLKNSSNLTS